MKEFFRIFHSGAGLFLILQGFAFSTFSQLSAEIVNLEMMELKGPVKSVTFQGLCQGPISAPMILDTSTCSEVYHFTETGWMSYFATYDKYGDCNKRISVEYQFGDQISEYISVIFRDTMYYQASYDLLGRLIAYQWKKNGFPYQSAVFGPRSKSGESFVEFYEKGVKTKEAIQYFNEQEFLVREDIKELSTGVTTVHKITFLDSLPLSDEGLEIEVYNTYDESKRLIQAKSVDKLGVKEVFYTYDEAGRLIVMTYKEGGKMADKYVFKYDQEGRMIHGDLFLDEYTLLSTTDMIYDAAGRIVTEISKDNIGTLSEKIIETSFVYDHHDNWIEKMIVVKMSGMSAETKVTRSIVYY
ncbi:MAG: RHS repeat protein [Bacteroidetes bacterium]|nr:RHS repeat protein [Bacteroidota bacterium]